MTGGSAPSCTIRVLLAALTCRESAGRKCEHGGAAAAVECGSGGGGGPRAR